jgi:hypothetical protein
MPNPPPSRHAQLFLTPLPVVLLKCCGGDDDGFSGGSRGRHWAEFMCAFFFTGTIAVPVLLANAQVVPMPALGLSLGGIALGLVAMVAGSWISKRGEEGEGLTLGF